MEPTLFREVLWAIFSITVFLSFLFFISAAPFKSKKKRYKIGMYSTEHFNSTLKNVEEQSVMDMIIGYYNKPFYYMEIKDYATDNLLIVKASEQHQKDRVQIENWIRRYLKKGSRIKILTTRDKYFHITIERHI